MQMYDVSLAELTQSGDVSACVGNVNLKQMMLAEMKMEEHDKSLPKEAPLSPRGLRQSYYGDVVRKLVADKHLGFHTVVVQRVQKSVGGNSCPACFRA